MDINDYKKSGCISLDQDDFNDPGTMLVVQNLLDKQQESWVRAIEEIKNQYQVSDDFALNMWYLRSRSRWTMSLEMRLVQMDRDNEPSPNMCEWP